MPEVIVSPMLGGKEQCNQLIDNNRIQLISLTTPSPQKVSQRFFDYNFESC